MGRGRSQKLARREAADAALEKLITSCKAPVSSEGPSGITYSSNPPNALSKLNELRQGLVYNLESRTGPDHQPVFTMTVTVILYFILMKSISYQFEHRLPIFLLNDTGRW